jgi:hypothetical protein
MAGGGQTGGPAGDSGQSLDRAWQPYRGIYDVPGRLSQSATIALIASPIGLLLISVIRLLIVADYNPVTASAIVSSGGYVDTLLGTIIPLVPLFVPYLALLLLFFNRVILGILALLATAFMSPVAIARQSADHLAGTDWHLITHRTWIIIVVLVLLGLVFVGLLLLEFMGLGSVVTIRTFASVTCLVLIPVVALLYPFPLSNQFYSDRIKQPWLPAEMITLASGQRFIGYVLSDNGAWIVVLDDVGRTVQHYRAAQVVSQEICQIVPTVPMPPLIPLYPAHLHSPTVTPACGSLAAGQPFQGRPGPTIRIQGRPAGDRARPDGRPTAPSLRRGFAP